MRLYTMQDRSPGYVAREDVGLRLQQVLTMTDYTADEVDKIADLEVGHAMLIGTAQDIAIMRTN